MNYKECLLSIKKDHGKGILLNKQQFSQVLFETISMCENENQLIKGAVDIGIGEKIYDLFGLTAIEQVDELKLIREIIKKELNYNDSDSLFVIQSLCIMCDIDCTEFLSLQDEEIKSKVNNLLVRSLEQNEIFIDKTEDINESIIQNTTDCKIGDASEPIESNDEENAGTEIEDSIVRVGTINETNNDANECVPETPKEIAEQLVSEGHQVLEAIKLLREKTGLGLAEAKNYVEAAIKNNPNYTTTQKNGGCYVATCVYGSYDCSQVWTLRRFRDYTLAKTWYGRAFVKTYYLISPQIVKLFGDNKLFKSLCKHILDKMVSNLKIKGFSDDKYNDIEW